MGLFGSIAGGALGAVGSIFGGISASKAMKKVKKNLQAQHHASGRTQLGGRWCPSADNEIGEGVLRSCYYLFGIVHFYDCLALVEEVAHGEED